MSYSDLITPENDKLPFSDVIIKLALIHQEKLGRKTISTIPLTAHNNIFISTGFLPFVSTHVHVMSRENQLIHKV